MKTITWILILGILLKVDDGLGSDARAVFFPEDENDEVSTKSHHRKRYKNLKFRIDADDVPCESASLPFCEKLTNRAYPAKYVETILAKTDAQTYENYFNRTVPSDESIGVDERLGSDLSLANRIGVELCASYKRLIYPQLAMNIENDWRFVIQSQQSRQPIRVEICQNKNGKCKFSESFPKHYASKCVQKSTKVPLLSLGENGELVSYDYEFPSYCQCELHELNDYRRF